MDVQAYYQQYYQQYYQEYFNVPTIITGIALAVLGIIGLWRMFEKAGLAGWKSIIPLYSTYCLFEITFGEGKGWMFLLMMIPCVGFIVNIFLAGKTARAFGKGGLFAVGLYFLPMLFWLILGLGQSVYQKPVA